MTTPNAMRAYPEDCALLKAEFAKIRSSPGFQASVAVARRMIEGGGPPKKDDLLRQQVAELTEQVKKLTAKLHEDRVQPGRDQRGYGNPCQTGD